MGSGLDSRLRGNDTSFFKLRRSVNSGEGNLTDLQEGAVRMAASGRSAGPQHNGRPPILEGGSFPLGATVYPDGVNFSVFSRDADTIELLLFHRVDDARESRIIPLDPKKNRTYHYWHAFVPDLGPGQIYGYRAIGPHEPSKGLGRHSGSSFRRRERVRHPPGIAGSIHRSIHRRTSANGRVLQS
jgi:hypothetical protein